MGVNRPNDSLPKSDRTRERARRLLLGNEGNTAAEATAAAAGKENEALGRAETQKEAARFSARKWSIWAILAAFFLEG